MKAPFESYRDANTRIAMVAFLAERHAKPFQWAEAELMSMNHVGLAYVHRDMIEARDAVMHGFQEERAR